MPTLVSTTTTQVFVVIFTDILIFFNSNSDRSVDRLASPELFRKYTTRINSECDE